MQKGHFTTGHCVLSCSCVQRAAIKGIPVVYVAFGKRRAQNEVGKDPQGDAGETSLNLDSSRLPVAHSAHCGQKELQKSPN